MIDTVVAQLEAVLTRHPTSPGAVEAVHVKVDNVPLPGRDAPPVLLLERHGYHAMPANTLTQTRIIRAAHSAELALAQSVTFDLAEVDRDLTPRSIGGHPWTLLHSGAFTVVRQRRWNGLYVVRVEDYRYGPPLQAALLEVP